MKVTSIAVSLLVLVLTFGCKNQTSTTSNTTPSDNTSVSQTANLSPEELGELGAKIKKNPSDAEKLLSEKGLTEKSFEQQIRQVAQDPEASKKYSEAFKKASA